jgi:deazaflavin-dependent oxidoreductase (nitroreductase family)
MASRSHGRTPNGLRREISTTETGSRGEPVARWLPSQPNRALGFGLRLPAYLYRFRLGRMLGHRFLLLSHRGRKSGLIRRTPLEVLLYELHTRESVVLSAWGQKADWYRNIEASPPLEVETGGERYPPALRFLAAEEAYAVITEYAIRHPLAARVLERVFGYPVTRSAEARWALAESVALVAFRPRGRREKRPEA